MNYKKKYLKYKSRYLKLKKYTLVGGSASKTSGSASKTSGSASKTSGNNIYLSDNNFYNNNLKINLVEELDWGEVYTNHDDVYFLRKNRSMLKNNLDQVKDKTSFEYEMSGKEINLAEYRYFIFNDDGDQERLVNKNKIITTDVVIVGAGPVGLLTGIKARLVGRTVAIIELRENNTRNEIFMLQQNNKFNSIEYLTEIGVLDEALKHGCWVSPPNRFAADCRLSTRDDEGKRLAIRIKDLQFILEKRFIDLGGIIIRPSSNRKLQYYIVRSGKSITFQWNDANHSVITINSVSVYDQLELKWKEILIAADGVSSNTRRNHFKDEFYSRELTFYNFNKNQNKLVKEVEKDTKDKFEK